jgi:hypothetical protein
VNALPKPAQVQTASTSLPQVGLISFGVLFVAAIVIAIGVVRRRARRG